MRQLIRISVPVLILMGWLIACFDTGPQLMQGNVIAKWFWMKGMAIGTLVFIGGHMLLSRKKMALAWSDLLILALVVWLLVRSLFSNQSFSWLFTNVAAVCILWWFIRLFFRRKKTVEAVILIYLAIVVIQCVIGLLQLYGCIGSNHSLFPITGTFHNPGPFSGFVVSGWPMVLGLYFMTRRRIAQRTQSIISPGAAEENNSCRLAEFADRLKDTEGGVLQKSKLWQSVKSVVDAIRAFKIPDSVRLLHYFSQVVLVLLLLVLPAARSRAAWLAGIVGSAFVLWHFKEDLKITSRNSALSLRFSALQRKLIVSFSLILLLVALVGLYKFKQGSADGRLLMWQVSWEMIKDKPLLGWGPGGFEAHYGNYQAGWFKSGKGTSEQELVAGTPDAPFNEFVRIWVEFGVLGLLLVLLILFSLFKSRQMESRFKVQSLRFNVVSEKGVQPETFNLKLITLLKGGLLSIIVFSLFSYPLDVAPIVIQIIILIALITNLQQNNRNLKPVTFNLKPETFNILTKLTALILLILVPYLAQQTMNQYKGYKHWKEAYQLYQYQVYDDAAEEYEKALEYLPENGLLLQVYGKCLAMLVNSEQLSVNSNQSSVSKAKEILERAAYYRSDPILHTTLADVYKALGRFKQAEKAYMHAWQMVPHKFYPKYLLAKLYNETGQRDKAQQLAGELLEKAVKVDSRAIEEMRTELQKILTNKRGKNRKPIASKKCASCLLVSLSTRSSLTNPDGYRGKGGEVTKIL